MLLKATGQIFVGHSSHHETKVPLDSKLVEVM